MNQLANLFTNLFHLTWQQSWELVGWTMCYFLAAGTLVAVGGALLRLACCRAIPQIRYTVSLAVFAALAMLPLVIAFGLWQTMPTQTLPPAINTFDSSIARPSWPTTDENTLATNPVMPTLRSQSLNNQERLVEIANDFVSSRQYGGAMVGAIEYLPWVWLIGTPLTFALLATGLIGSERLRKKSTRLIEGPIYDACRRLRVSLAVSRRVGIAINERIASPLLVGIVRPLILLPPAALTGWSPDELEMVLLHELAHVRRWDNLVNFLQRIVESLLFFHPAVWWVSRWVRRDREECCDAVVIARTAKPQAYAELLVTLASGSTPLAGLAMAQHPLAGRIRRILKLEDEKMLVSRGTLGWLGLALVAVLAVILWQPTTTLVAEETNQTVVAGKEELTTEDTDSTEEKKNNKDKERVVLSIDVNTPVSKINKIIEQHKLAGKNISIKANDDGTMTLTTIMDNQPPTVVSAKRIKFDGDQIKLEGITRAQANSPFLSLKDQRAADLAYKLLGLELEPLRPGELERVKGFDYQGGLRVATDSTTGPSPKADDLLVGIHIWPVTSLEDVRKILQREDLAELSPLKFYGLRAATNTLGQQIPSTDKRIAGRIKVNTKWVPQKITSIPDVLSPGDRVKVVVSGTYPDWPINKVATIESAGTLALKPTYGRVKVADLTLLEAEQAVQKQLGKIIKALIEESVKDETLVEERLKAKLKEIPVQITLVEKAKAERSSAAEPALLSYARSAESPSQQKTRLKRELLIARARLQVAHANQERKLAANQVQPGAVSKLDLQESQAAIQRAELLVQRSEALLNDLSKKQPTTLLYDNKTFDQWRSQWKNELKTEKRTEAIRAMAAFGRAGYGKEAAEAILDVAGEYDFSLWGDDDPEGKLKEQVLDVLNNNKNMRLKPSWWLSDLLKRYQADQRKWKKLVLAAIPQISGQSLDEATRDQLIELALGNDEVLRSVAASGLYGVPYDDPTIIPVVKKLIVSADPTVARQGIYLNVWFPSNSATNAYGQYLPHQAKVRSMPDLLAALQHNDETVRRTARERLRLINKKDAMQITMRMAKDLQNAPDDKTRLLAIRALAALGDSTENVSGLLRTHFEKKHSPAVRTAAVFANMRINTNSTDFQPSFLKTLELEDFTFTDQHYREEYERVYGMQYNPGGGGGGFGGGGGGFF